MDTYLYAPSIVLFIQYSLIFQRCPLYMEPQNLTGVSEFLLLGLSGYPDPQPLLFGLFLSMYLVTVLGKLLIILAVTFDPHLHTPIYFFLSNLSLADISFNTTTVPKMLVNLQTQQIHHLCRLPSWGDRLFSFCMFRESPSDSDGLWPVGGHLSPPILPVHHEPPPLWLLGPGVIFHQTFELPASLLDDVTAYLCTEVEMPHFFCDPSKLLNLACSENSINIILIYFNSTIVGGIPLSGTLYSYSQIVSSILRVSSSGGKYKALSTCDSHLSVVCLFYGPGLGV